jgi:agmatinase
MISVIDYTRDLQPYFAGIATFLRAPMAEICSLERGTLAVVGIPIDTAKQSRTGSRFGPRAMREASLIYEGSNRDPESVVGYGPDELVHLVTGKRLKVTKKHLLRDVGDVNIYPADMERTTESVRNGIKAITERGAVPIILGGDHYITYPSVLGYWAGLGGRRPVGYIHVDSHLDTADNNRIWGRINGGTFIPRLTDAGAINGVSTAMLGIVPTYVLKEQYDFVKNNKVKMVTIDEARQKGLAHAVDEVWEHAATNTAGVYISIDIDVCDGAYAPGTGGVVCGGMTSLEVLTVAEQLAAKAWGAVDLAELSPPLDPTGRTQALATRLITTFIMARITEEVRT